MADAPGTAAMIREIELFDHLPITQLRAHVKAMAPKLIAHMRARDAEIAALKKPEPA